MEIAFVHTKLHTTHNKITLWDTTDDIKEVYMDQIWSAIGQYAFPIVACVVMGWYVKYIQDNYRKDISDISSRHKEEMDKVTTALNNNTLAIQRLTDFIEKDAD